MIWALNDLRGLSDISLFILLWLLLALSSVHPSYDRELLCPEPYLLEVIFNMKNLVLMTRLVPPVAGLPVKIASCMGVLEHRRNRNSKSQ
jgi:hypothetical protein